MRTEADTPAPKPVDIGVTDTHGRKYMILKVATWETLREDNLLVLYKTWDSEKNGPGEVLQIFNLAHVITWELF